MPAYATAPFSVPGTMPGAGGYATVAMAPTEEERERKRLALPVIAAILLAVLVLGTIGGVVLLHGLGAGRPPAGPGAHATGTIAGTPGHQVATHPSGTGTQPTATTAAQATVTPGGPTPTTTTGAAAHISVANPSVKLAVNAGKCTGFQTMTNDGPVDTTWSWSSLPGTPHWSFTDQSDATISPTSANALAHGASVTIHITYDKSCTGNSTPVNVTVANGTASPPSFTMTY